MAVCIGGYHWCCYAESDDILCAPSPNSTYLTTACRLDRPCSDAWDMKLPMPVMCENDVLFGTIAVNSPVGLLRINHALPNERTILVVASGGTRRPPCQNYRASNARPT